MIDAVLAYLQRVGIAISVLLNVVLGGSSNQTFSARNWELKRQGKLNAVWLIDPIFVIIGHILSRILRRPINLEQHCLESWSYWHIRKRI